MNDIFVGRAYVILEKSIIYRVYVAAWTFIPYAYLLKITIVTQNVFLQLSFNVNSLLLSEQNYRVYFHVN